MLKKPVKSAFGWNHLAVHVKILLLAGLCFLVATGSIIVFSAVNAYNSAVDLAKNEAHISARSEAALVKVQMERAFVIAETVANTLSAVKEQDNPMKMGRQDVAAMLRQILANNPELVSNYMRWEPNAFDGQDALFKSEKTSNSSGQLVVYWYRDASGALVLDQSYDPKDADAEYYTCVKVPKAECLLEPYEYDAGGNKFLLVSAVAPIMHGDQFLGSSEVDFSLVTLQKMIDQVKLYDGKAQVALISHSGLLVGVSGRPDLINKKLENFDPQNAKAILQALAGGQEFQLLTADDLIIAAPVT